MHINYTFEYQPNHQHISILHYFLKEFFSIKDVLGIPGRQISLSKGSVLDFKTNNQLIFVSPESPCDIRLNS